MREQGCRVGGMSRQSRHYCERLNDICAGTTTPTEKAFQLSCTIGNGRKESTTESRATIDTFLLTGYTQYHPVWPRLRRHCGQHRRLGHDMASRRLSKSTRPAGLVGAALTASETQMRLLARVIDRTEDACGRSPDADYPVPGTPTPHPLSLAARQSSNTALTCEMVILIQLLNERPHIGIILMKSLYIVKASITLCLVFYARLAWMTPETLYHGILQSDLLSTFVHRERHRHRRLSILLVFLFDPDSAVNGPWIDRGWAVYEIMDRMWMKSGPLGPKVLGISTSPFHEVVPFAIYMNLYMYLPSSHGFAGDKEELRKNFGIPSYCLTSLRPPTDQDRKLLQKLIRF
ncbi:uncharacterized protein MYCFIDRAFT_172451 [Pseudocercospora fijiensis CIRAD86]|uniref:Uncharacterized protein n=1 Tax=Pseudocercospora fijiensis (strain CIRAD86) TaxID=383855 RepID=M3BC77_PSEFD|nr:uncharacterized protein MYCFIDRAFT_172451 [Pseudocercospora fijiensis CIRAD86]EME86753.1 hypothetical protein MYCFIDRAFT_172451 [Pseudocercospora fijiensis CIRAD86]